MPNNTGYKKHVWYVGYGSNMLRERLMTYITGGICRFNGKEYDGCTEKDPPKEIKAVNLPFNVFYGNKSSSWNESAVSFLDDSKPGFAYGRAYLVTEKQLFEIQNQEGPSYDWYGHKLSLGKIGFFEAFTFTCGRLSKTFKYRKNFSDVSEKYIDVLKLGLKEAIPSLSEEEIIEYLKQCGDN